jgi:hypothetical protein
MQTQKRHEKQFLDTMINKHGAIGPQISYPVEIFLKLCGAADK